MTTTRLSRAIAIVVQRELRQRDLQAAAFARKAGLDKSKVHKVLTGKIQSVSVDDALAFSKGLDWKLSRMVREAGMVADAMEADDLFESMDPETQAAISPLRDEKPTGRSD